MSKYVLSGGTSYIDYDLPWGNQRQWLVSESNANILSNFLAVFLTIAIQRGFFAIVKRIILPNCPMTKGISENRNVADQLQSAEELDARNMTEQSQSTEGLNLSDVIVQSQSEEGPNLPNVAETSQSIERLGFPNVAGQSQPARGLSLRDVTKESHSAEGLSLRSLASFFGRVVPGLIQVGTDIRSPNWSRVSGSQFWLELWSNFKHVSAESSDLLLTLLMAFVMAAIFFGSILVGVYSALVISTTVAISAHPGCNIYIPDFSWDNPLFTNTQKYFHEIEVESGEYARRCYNATDGSDSCNYFYKQSIQFSATENTTCPFRSGSEDLCFDGPSSALTLTTGKVAPQTIGINTPLKYTFERETTCSPLRMDGDLIQRVVDDKNTVYYQYFYGSRVANQFGCPSNLINCTYELPFIIDQSYKVYTAQWRYPLQTSSQIPISLPLWETNDTDEISSIILVQNVGVAYPDRREDPMFPADKTYDNGTWFYNTRWHAGVLGCVDRTTICSPNGTVCGGLKYWSELEPSDTEDFRVVVMLFWSILQSNIQTAIMYRAAEGLDAQTKIVGSYSLQLALEQWKIEVHELFKTSLARIQVDARNIARGPPSGHAEGLRSLMRPFYQGICRMYKFNSIGWRNVSVSGFMVAISVSLLIIIASVPGRDEKLWFEGPLQKLGGIKIIEFCAGKCRNYCQPGVTILSGSVGKGMQVVGGFIWDQLSKDRPKLKAFCWETLKFIYTCLKKLVEGFLKFLKNFVGGVLRGIDKGWKEIDRLFRSETRRRQETTVEM